MSEIPPIVRKIVPVTILLLMISTQSFAVYDMQLTISTPYAGYGVHVIGYIQERNWLFNSVLSSNKINIVSVKGIDLIDHNVLTSSIYVTPRLDVCTVFPDDYGVCVKVEKITVFKSPGIIKITL